MAVDRKLSFRRDLALTLCFLLGQAWPEAVFSSTLGITSLELQICLLSPGALSADPLTLLLLS